MQTGKTIKFGIAACVRVCALSSVLFLVPVFGAAEVLSGVVVGVSDGDTIKVLDDRQHPHHIRLMGIDAPEKAQAFGQRSKQSLSDLVHGQRVRVEWSKRDRYGRTLGKVLDQDGKDICLEQVTRGMAWHYKKYSGEQSEKDRIRYADEEKVARESKVGLWQDDAASPPWDWRHAKAK